MKYSFFYSVMNLLFIQVSHFYNMFISNYLFIYSVIYFQKIVKLSSNEVLRLFASCFKVSFFLLYLDLTLLFYPVIAIFICQV